MEDYGLFIGMTNVPVYSNSEFNPEIFEKNIISQTFNSFRESLNDSLLNNEKLDKVLYNPINFYAFGSFNLISLSFIDDFHFGNFSFRPFNKHIKKEFLDFSNFQYQVVNNFNLKFCDGYSINNLKQASFIGISKIKINSALLIGDDGSFISKIKDYILNNLENEKNIKVILGESFSWHELTLIFYGNNIEEMLKKVNYLRSLTIETIDFDLCKDNLLFTIEPNPIGINIFTDTETIYGKNTSFFDKSSNFFDEFCKKRKIEKTDEQLKVNTKIHIKTGHCDDLFDFLDNKEFDELIEKDFLITNGRSDHSIKYKDDAIENYLKFWRSLQFSPTDMTSLFSHVRKIHTNLATNYKKSSPKNLNTSFYLKLFEKLKFHPINEILVLEEEMQSLKVPKEVANKVLVLFTNFNDIICDVNLYMYFIDLKSILQELKNVVNLFASGKNTYLKQNEKIRKVRDVTAILLEYVEVFQNAYQNRYLDSKKLGYNLDIKGDFNGGVHQIIHSLDSIHKIVSIKLSAANIQNTFLPVATYGSLLNDIKASRINLHLNYFQLFQPETFLYSIIKENLNFVLDKSFLINLQKKSPSLIDFNSKFERIKEDVSKQIHSVADLNKRQILYGYLPPDKLLTKISYIFNYTLFVNIQWLNNIEAYIFWNWNYFIQNPNSYNIDGTLRIDLFREHFLAFYISIRANQNINYKLTKESFLKIIKNADIEYYLFDESCNVFNEVESVYKYIFSEIPNLSYLLSEIQFMGFTLLNSEDVLKSSFPEIQNLIIEYLEKFKTYLLHDNKSNSFIRNHKTGKGINRLKNYDKGVFDPHGGLFIVDKELRIKFLNERINIISSLRKIGYKYKKGFYLENI